ncbi:hypothetical protein ScPMuIL_003389 [Solemya velum]
MKDETHGYCKDDRSKANGPTTASITGNRDVYADNNQELTLTCEPGTVRPGATYTWRKNSVKINGETQKTLTFTPTSTDNMAVISCVASNSQYPDITATGSATLNVYYSPTPPVVAGYNPPSFISEGDPLTLRCTVQDANPTPTLRWTGCSGMDADTNTPGTVGKSRTMASVQRVSNMATCSCIAEQTANNNWSARAAVNITVHFGPDSLSLAANDTNMVEFDHVSFTCSSTESNPKVNFTWHKNGGTESVGTVPVYSTTGRQNGGTFTEQTWIRQVSRNDRTLSCTTQNNRGLEVKKTMDLDIKYTPIKGPVITRYVNGSVKSEKTPIEQLQIKCTQSGGNPLPDMTLVCPSSTPATSKSASKATASATVSVQRNINNKKCTCTSTQTGTGWKQEASIMFVVHFGPDSLSLTVNSNTLVAGDTVVFTCTSEISNPPTSLAWLKNNTVISNTMPQVDTPGMYGGKTTTQKWSMQLSRDDDKKVIKCQTTNTLGPVSKTMDLDVEYGVYGTAVSLSPQETSEGVMRAHSGSYECRTQNKHNVETVPVDITVKYPPNVSVTYSNATENAAEVVITCFSSRNN